MTPTIRLSDYPTAPLYNIKAVVQATSISSSTLRAWERRYNMVDPQRSDSGYRLYSDRDIAVIRWLKAQVDAGMSISQAVAWMDQLVDRAGGSEKVVLPFSGEVVTPAVKQAPKRTQARDFAALRQELLSALLGYDEQAAELVLSEAFALYAIEQVGEELIAPSLVQIGELWHRGDITVTTEHYASGLLLQRLMSLLRVGSNLVSGPLIWVGCAPNELHEIGALLLAIYLRRAGHHVQYLGRNLPVGDLVQEAQQQQPAMIVFSATSSEAARGLRTMTSELAAVDSPRPIVGYGGRIFNVQPDLRNDIAGVFLGHTTREAVGIIGELLTNNHAVEWTAGNGTAH
ncbi:MAG: cobalamin B12-binding domain-containing protein [Caldilineaceae bacterium]|nr:cobalamin B12-binding domain-containing protein [Caldilineaceae bacterium]